MIKTNFLFALITTLFLGCFTTRTPNPLSVTRRDYEGHTLKTDGYYYAFSQNYGRDSLISLFVLYRNGVFLNLQSRNSVNLDSADRYINEMAAQKDSFRQKSPHGWGVFIIDNADICIEQWLDYNPSLKVPSFISQGKFLNDSTLSINLSRDKTWHFRAFSPKPDSTNGFIK